MTPCQPILSITETSVWESEWSFPLLTSSNGLRVTGNYTGVSNYQDRALAPSHVNTPWITFCSCALVASHSLTQMLLCRLTSSLARGSIRRKTILPSGYTSLGRKYGIFFCFYHLSTFIIFLGQVLGLNQELVHAG